MTYEARCILASMKETLSKRANPRRADWLALAHAIASGSLLSPAVDVPADDVTVLQQQRSVP